MTKAFEIQINEKSRVPKYLQIVNSILDGISHGKIKVGEKIPSINELSEMCFLSRDTVEKAYKHLRDKQIIVSVKGKGYYITRMDNVNQVSVLMLINKPSTYKMMIYNAFVNAIGNYARVDMYIYHCDETLFVNALERGLGAYDYYVIMPHFRDQNSNHVSYTDNAMQMIEKIPLEKLLMLDNIKPEIGGDYGAIYQDFENDIYNALKEGLSSIKKYEKVILVYPNKSANPYPKRILYGFKKFCVEHGFEFEILEEIFPDMEFEGKDLYITIQERDLVNLMHQIRSNQLELGKDIGIISYNDTPLKDLLGITVMSTDFTTMGETAAYMIRKGKKEKVNNVFKFIQRNSL